MKPPNRLWLTSIVALACLLGGAHRFHTPTVYAQQNEDDNDDGLIYVSASIDVDDNYNLYVDGFVEADLDSEEDFEDLEVYGAADKDGASIGTDLEDGYDHAEVTGELDGVAPGHEYGMYAEGFTYVCYDGGEEGGDCESDDLDAYASVNVPFPPPQITNISPSSVNQGDQGTLTVTGTNLVQGTGDQLTVNLSRNAGPFTPVGIPTATSATFSYDFTSYPTGTYNLTVQNNEAESDGTSFTVASPWPADPCAVASNPKIKFSSFVSTGTPGGSGTINVSFSDSAYSAVSQTVSYGPYSTPSSIASNIAALISANYKQNGLTARAFGSNVVYSGKASVGTVNHAITGSSVTTDSSPTAAASAAMACGAAPPIPLPVCGIVNPQYVLAVTNDSVKWVDEGLNHGRNVNYSLEYYPTFMNKLGKPVTFPSTVTEHLSLAMAYGLSTPGIAGTGEFDDFLGSTAANQSPNYTFTTDRCFTVASPTLGNLGQVMSYDAAGMHRLDHIQIHPSTKTSILNNWTNPDGSPKNIAIP